MTININELRSMVNGAQFESFANSVINSLLDRLEEAEKDIALKERVIDSLGSELNAVANERDELRALVVMRFDHDYPPQFTQSHNLHELNEPVTAEHCRWFVAEIERLKTERDALREKIACMERQNPVAQVGVYKTGGNAGIAWSARPLNEFDSLPLLRDGDKLYLAPGAQPAPSVPDGWLQHAARMAALARKLREPDWHFESIREMQRELCALEEAALAAAPEAKP